MCCPNTSFTPPQYCTVLYHKPYSIFYLILPQRGNSPVQKTRQDRTGKEKEKEKEKEKKGNRSMMICYTVA